MATVFVDFHQNKLFFLFVDSTWPKTGDVWTPWNGLTPTVQAVRRSGVREVEHLLSWVKDRSTLRKTRTAYSTATMQQIHLASCRLYCRPLLLRRL